MPIRSKNHRAEQATGFFKKAAAAGVLAAGVYGGAVVFHNVGGSGNSDDAINAIAARSKYDFIAQAETQRNAPRLTVSVEDIISINNGSISFYDGAAAGFIAAYSQVNATAEQWNARMRGVLKQIAAKNAPGFSFTFENKPDNASAVRLGSEYKIGIVPSATPLAWPKMEVRLGDKGFYGTMTLTTSWSDDECANAFQAFMKKFAADVAASKNAHNEAEADITGVYKLQRDDVGNFTAFKEALPKAEQRAESKTAETAQTHTANTPFQYPGADPLNIIKIWSRINYMEQLLGAEGSNLTLSLKDVYEAKAGPDVVSVYSGTKAEFIANYAKAYELSEQWNQSISAAAIAVGNDNQGLLTAASFYRLGIVPAAPDAAEPEMTLSVNRNGVYYANMTMPVSWDDKVRANALRAFLTRLKADKEAGAVTAGTYRLNRDNSKTGFSAYRAGTAIAPAVKPTVTGP